MENLTDQEICVNLKRLYNETENQVKTNAMVSRAFIDKVSIETINNKVTSQMNSIKTSIYNINPKFKEGSKNYDNTKKLVTETLANYEKALIELSEFYDEKIEQLILKKVTLESGLISSILNEEYLKHKIITKNNQKENDKLKKSLKENIKSVIEKIKTKKNDNSEFDTKMIANIMDQQEVAGEMEIQLTNRVEKSVKDKNDNKEFIESTEKEIIIINDEIDRINERKQKSLYDAMEVGDKALTASIKKPRMLKKITSFFVSRFNTAKVVESTIITPLNLRIENFRNVELANIKG